MSAANSSTYLGVSLGSRAVGFAVIRASTLLDYRVVNLRNIPGITLKEEAFHNALNRLLKTYNPGSLALCMKRGGVLLPMVALELHALEDLAKRRRLARKVYGTDVVRAQLMLDLAHPTNRDLARHLTARFGIEDEHISAAFTDPAPRVPTDRERYWARMVLALGVAELLRQEDAERHHS
jgi:hypothetical protein